jgi:quercetin dioxygenase-like cupin family protein
VSFSFIRFGGRAALGTLLCVVPLALRSQQATAPIPLEKEPHHELVFHDKDFLAFRVKMPPGDTLLLHRHAYDEAALTISSGATVAIFPGRPEVHQTDVPATVRFHQAGVVHQIRNVSDSPFYLHYSISLLHPQKDIRSLCAAADTGGPLNCPASQTEYSAGVRVQPQYETNQLRAEIMLLQQHHSTMLGDMHNDAFVVAIDEVESANAKSSAPKTLKPGDFLWIEHSDHSHSIRNDGDREARMAIFWFRPAGTPPFGKDKKPRSHTAGL